MSLGNDSAYLLLCVYGTSELNGRRAEDNSYLTTMWTLPPLVK